MALAAAVSFGIVAGHAVSATPPPAERAVAESDWRTPDPQNVLVITTNKGVIYAELAPELAPAHVERVKQLTRQGFYDGLSFFRVIENFMDQTGDPQNTGGGGSTLANLGPEFVFRRGSDSPFALAARIEGAETGFIHSMPVVSQALDLGLLTADHRVKAYGAFCKGVLGMARASEPDSANSQFFLMRADHRALDGQYTPFGRVIAGQDVVDAIKTGEPVEAPQDRMLSVKLLVDLPAATRPRVRVVDPSSAWFQARVARSVASQPNAFTPCDIDFPNQVTPGK